MEETLEQVKKDLQEIKVTLVEVERRMDVMIMPKYDLVPINEKLDTILQILNSKARGMSEGSTEN